MARIEPADEVIVSHSRRSERVHARGITEAIRGERRKRGSQAVTSKPHCVARHLLESSRQAIPHGIQSSLEALVDSAALLPRRRKEVEVRPDVRRFVWLGASECNDGECLVRRHIALGPTVVYELAGQTGTVKKPYLSGTGVPIGEQCGLSEPPGVDERKGPSRGDVER